MSSTAAARPTRGARASVTGLFLSAGAAFGGWAASVATIKEGLGVSDGALGAALLCVSFGAMVAMPVIGWLGAKGVPGLMRLTTVAVMVVMPLPALAGSLPALAVSLFLLGAAAGSMDVCMNARASRIEGAWGAAIMSSFHAAFSLGGLLGAGIAALSLAAGGGALGALGGVSLLVLVTLLAHWALDPHPDLASGGGTPGLVWPTRAVAGLGLLCALAFLCEGAVADWSGVFLRDVAGFDPSGSVLGFGAFSLAMVAARLMGDTAVRRLGQAPMLVGGACLAATGVVVATAAPAVGPVGFFLVGLGAGNAAPILFSTAGRSGPASLAAVATFGYGGMLCGPPAIGGISEIIGLRVALQVLTLASLTIAVGARRAIR